MFGMPLVFGASRWRDWFLLFFVAGHSFVSH
jgi:hypothetical protein